MEEWAEPPRPGPGEVASGHRSGPKWISWVLWWPTMMVLRHCQSTPEAHQISSLFAASCSLAIFRLPHPPLAHFAAPLTPVHLLAAVYHHCRVPPSAVLRDEGHEPRRGLAVGRGAQVGLQGYVLYSQGGSAAASADTPKHSGSQRVCSRACRSPDCSSPSQTV